MIATTDMQYIAAFGEQAFLDKKQADLNKKELARLRDEFAMHVISGLMANPNVIAYNHNCGWALVNAKNDDIAAFCNKQVNSMMKAREVKHD